MSGAPCRHKCRPGALLHQCGVAGAGAFVAKRNHNTKTVTVTTLETMKNKTEVFKLYAADMKEMKAAYKKRHKIWRLADPKFRGPQPTVAETFRAWLRAAQEELK